MLNKMLLSRQQLRCRSAPEGANAFQSAKPNPVSVRKTPKNPQKPRMTTSRYNHISRTTTIALSIFHAGAIAAFFFFSWQAFWTALFLNWLALSLGIGMGYHRLLTH